MQPPSLKNLRHALTTLKCLAHTKKKLDRHLYLEDTLATEDVCACLASITGEHATIVGPRAPNAFGARKCRDCKGQLDGIDLREAEVSCFLCRDKLAGYASEWHPDE